MEIFAQLVLEGHICSEYLCLHSEGGKLIACKLRHDAADPVGVL